MVEDRIVREDGYVALRFYKNLPRIVGANGREYVVSIQYNCAILWVHPDDVQPLLNIQEGCCGNAKHNICRLATNTDLSIYSTGHLP